MIRQLQKLWILYT